MDTDVYIDDVGDLIIGETAYEMTDSEKRLLFDALAEDLGFVVRETPFDTHEDGLEGTRVLDSLEGDPDIRDLSVFKPYQGGPYPYHEEMEDEDEDDEDSDDDEQSLQAGGCWLIRTRNDPRHFGVCYH